MSDKIISRKDLVQFGKNRAIIIGIDHYPEISNGSLSTPVTDAEAFKEVLIKYQGFGEEDIQFLANPSKTEIEGLLEREKTIAKSKFGGVEEGSGNATALQDDKKPVNLKNKGCLIFYYAGHGVAGDLDVEGNGPAGYILPSDAEMQSTSLKENSSLVKMDDVFDAIVEMDYHHTLLILDCCFAGAINRIQKTRASFGLGHRPMTRTRFNRYTQNRAFEVLVSAGPAEKAADWISERGSISIDGKAHSPFAKSLIDALSPDSPVDVKPRGKSLGDGVITSNELFIHLHEQVENKTRKDKNFKPQHPGLFPMSKNHENGQFVFCDPRYPLNKLSWAKHKNDNPYKGLLQFDIPDSGYYFGREDDVRELVRAMKLKQFSSEEENTNPPHLLMVSGPSGSGKSSLVKAGLLPHFLDEGYELFQLRPGDRPWKLLNYQKKAGVEEEDPDNYFWKELYSSDKLRLKKYYKSSKKQVFYLDQYEEAFTECTVQEREAIEAQLIDLMEMLKANAETNTTKPTHIILSMRSDFEWQLEQTDFGQRYWKNKKEAYLHRLQRLNIEGLRNALVNPAQMLVYEFEKNEEKDLVDIILSDLNYSSRALPVLSCTMEEFVRVNKKKRGGDKRRFTFETYEEIGGVSGVLSTRMDQIYSSFADPNQLESVISLKQQLMKIIYLRMVRVNDGQDTRRKVFLGEDYNELRYFDDRQQSLVEDILETLKGKQIISKGGTTKEEEQIKRKGKGEAIPEDAEVVPGGKGELVREVTIYLTFYELIHDSLITSWSLGKKWIEEYGRENLIKREKLWEAARAYHGRREGKDANKLLWHNNIELRPLMREILDRDNFYERLWKKIARFYVPDEDEKPKKVKGRHPFNTLELAFLDESTRLKKRINRQIIIGAIAVMAVLAGISLVAFWMRDEALDQQQKKEELTRANFNQAKALQIRGKNPTLALRMAELNYLLHPDKSGAASTFRQLLMNEKLIHYKNRISRQEDYPFGVVLLPDSTSDFMTIDTSKALSTTIFRKWTSNGILLDTLNLEEYFLGFSPNQTTMLTYLPRREGEKDTLQFWNFNLRERSKPLLLKDTFRAIISEDTVLVQRNDSFQLIDSKGKYLGERFYMEGAFNRYLSKSRQLITEEEGTYYYSMLEGDSINGQESIKIGGTLIKSTIDSRYGVFRFKTVDEDGYEVDSIKVYDFKEQEEWFRIAYEYPFYIEAFITFGGDKTDEDPDDHTQALFYDTENDEVRVKIYDHGGNLEHELRLFDGQEVNLSLAPTYSSIFSYSEDQLSTWNLSKDKSDYAFASDSWNEIVELWDFGIDPIYLSLGNNIPQNKTILTDSILIWETEEDTSSVIKLNWRSQTVDTLIPQWDRIKTLTVSPDKTTMLIASDSSLVLWNIDGTQKQTISIPSDNIKTLKYAPNGLTFLVGLTTKTVLFDKEGVFLDTLKACRKASYSPDGTTILCIAKDSTVQHYSIKEQKQELFTTVANIDTTCFTPDGNNILTLAEQILIRWNLDGTVKDTFAVYREDEEYFTLDKVICFSPVDQSILIAPAALEAAELYDNEGQLLNIFTLMEGLVSTVAFSPQGRYMIIGSTRGEVKILDPQGHEVQSYSSPLKEKDIEVSSISFTEDGQFILINYEGDFYMYYSPWGFLEQNVKQFTIEELEAAGLKLSKEEKIRAKKISFKWEGPS